MWHRWRGLWLSLTPIGADKKRLWGFNCTNLMPARTPFGSCYGSIIQQTASLRTFPSRHCSAVWFFQGILTRLLRTKKGQTKINVWILPRFKWSLLLNGPDSFSCHRQLCQVHIFCLPVAVGEFKHAVPLPLHSAHHCVGCVLLHFTRDSRKWCYF